MEYVTIEALRDAAERDVEVGGQTYRVRRVTPIELLEAWGTVPMSPDDEAGNERVSPARARKMNQNAAKLLVLGLVAPSISAEQLHLIPHAAWEPLIAAIADLSGMSRPFAGDASPSVNS